MKRDLLLALILTFGFPCYAAPETAPAADDGAPPEDAAQVSTRSALPTGPYMKTCKDPILRDGILYATCLQSDKTQRQAKMVLPCAGKIENKAGALVCAK